MLKVFFIAAWRNLTKHKGYTFLNVLGLSAGLTCFAFIAVWVKHESSYDRFHTNYNRIVRLTGIAKTETGIQESAMSSPPMAAALKNDYSEVEEVVRMDMNADVVVEKDGQQILETDLLFTDPSFFTIFNFQLTKGSVQTALTAPYSIILTESTAKKYFGDLDPLGKTLRMYLYDEGNRGALYTVTGIIPDAPDNSHFNYNIIGSFKTVEVDNPDVLTVDGWGDSGFYTYLLLKPGVDHAAFSSKITQFYGKYIGDLYNIWKDIYFYKLQPLKDIHLRSNLEYEIAVNGNIKQVYIFSTIGIFILLLAAINYVNLATARSVSRAREVGIKKVVGADRKGLITQFLAESVLTSFVALLFSFALSVLVQPAFYQLTGKNISPFSSFNLVFVLCLITFLLGLISGIYPAILISRFKPFSVLKGSFKTSTQGVLLRKSLVVLQFTITLILVTGIIVINSQLKYIQNKNLGYDNDSLLFLRVNGNTDIINGYGAFKNSLLSNSLIKNVTTSNSLPLSGLGSGGARTVDANGNTLEVNTARLRIDPDYLSTYGIKLIAGRNFTNTSSTDTIRPVILNEAAIKNFGWKNPESAIGKPFGVGGTEGVVIGVVKDFNFSSLQRLIEPLALFPVATRFSMITVKADLSKASDVIAAVQSQWKKMFPSALFDYRLLNDQIGEQYTTDKKFSKIFLYFSVLSLLIACLGLYGLISYAVSQRTKEIGIRKIIGASAKTIVFILSESFLKLVIVALIIAIPVTWFVMTKWLEDFAYRTNITAWMFAIAGITVITLAFAAIAFQVIKAALANPVNALRTE